MVQAICMETTCPCYIIKKSNSIAYHFVRECVAMGELLTGYIKSEENPSDLMTKALPGGEKRAGLLRQLMWAIK